MSRVVLRSALIIVVSALVCALWALKIGRDFHVSAWEELVPIGLMNMPYAAAVSGVGFAIVVYFMRRRPGPWIAATILVLGTVLWWGPLSAFHHMFKFGVVSYMIIDCDSPPEDLPIPWGDCGIRYDPIGLSLTIVVWLTFVVAFAVLVRRRQVGY